MRVLSIILVVSFVIFLFVIKVANAIAPGSDIQTPSNYKLLSTGPKGSKLYQITAENSVYSEQLPYLLDLTAKTSFDQGYDVGYLLGEAYIENYNSLLVSMLGDESWEPTVAKLINLFLEWQWKDYLSVQVPDDFMQELRGLSAGGKAKGLSQDIGSIAGWGITLANFPGSLENLKYIFIDEKNNPPSSEGYNAFINQLKEMNLTLDTFLPKLQSVLKKFNGFQCSMYGVWGSRTENKKLYSGRNLDWLTDSGISKYKLVTVHHPKNGYAHATIAWAGIYGAITGISSQGITVHEANLESNDITFRGFPWVLRLRYVMANAKNLQEALSLWQQTNSTVGFNHGFGSANDGEAVCLETMMHNSAVFSDNDPREQYLEFNGENIGAPRAEAVYRTNHGYDPYTVQHYMWNTTNAYKYSITRYMLFPQIFDDYTASNKLISFKEAVNIT
jgi:hypothetical protein